MSKQDGLNDPPDSLDSAELEIERALKQLKPTKPAIDSAGVLSELVRRSESARHAARRQIWIWRGIAMAAAACLACVVWLHQPARVQDRVVVKIVHEHEPDAVAKAAQINDIRSAQNSCAYLILRRQVLEHGMAALPDAPGASEHSAESLGVERIRIDGL